MTARCRRIQWSAAELAFVEAHRCDYRSDAHREFVKLFDRTDVSLANYSGLCKRMGWLTGRLPGSGRKDGRRRNYSPEEVAFIKAQASAARGEMHAEFVAHFGRGDVSLSAYIGLRKNMKLANGLDARFRKGCVPANKGKKMPFNAASAATQFKPGQRPVNKADVGHRAMGKDGYWLVCVAEKNPWTGAPTRMAMEHRWRWEQANGPIPKGHVLKSLDGDRTNTDPSNWIAIPKGMLPRLNGKSGRNYDQAPAELKPLIRAAAALEHKARELRKGRSA